MEGGSVSYYSPFVASTELPDAPLDDVLERRQLGRLVTTIRRRASGPCPPPRQSTSAAS